MTRRKLLKSLCGAAAVAVLPALPAVAEKKYGRIPARSPLGRKVAYVTCDGVKVDHAYDADDIEGWVSHFAKVDGKFVIVGNDYEKCVGRFRKTGVVKFYWKDAVA
jgi:hypothetical protein